MNNLKGNEKINSLVPRILVFEDIKKVLPKYCELITTLKIGDKSVWEIALEEERIENKKKKIKAIGWVGEPNRESRKEDELTIQSYFDNFKKKI